MGIDVDVDRVMVHQAVRIDLESDGPVCGMDLTWCRIFPQYY
jgi:hypothetical protein